MLIAEELYLILTHASGKQERPGTQRGYGLTAALLADLVAAGRVELTADRKPQIRVVDVSPTGSPVLDNGLAKLAPRGGGRLDTLVAWGKLDPERDVVDSLVRSGVLELGERTMLGFGPPRTPERAPEPERALRARLAEVLHGQRAPSSADATLLAILQALNVAAPLLHAESGGMRPKELRQRIEQIVEKLPVGTAVEQAVQALNTTLMVAAMVPVMVAATST